MAALFAGIAIVLVVGTGVVVDLLRHPSLSHAAVLQQVEDDCAEVRWFRDHFPSAVVYISHFDGTASGTPRWVGEIRNSEVEIIATMPIVIDRRRNELVRTGPMRIDLLKIKDIIAHEDGSKSISYAEHKVVSVEELQNKLGGCADEAAQLDRLKQ